MDINPEGKKKPCRHRIYRVFAIRRGRRIRTLNKGFGVLTYQLLHALIHKD